MGAGCLSESDSLLKSWSQRLSTDPQPGGSEAGSVSNVSYTAAHKGDNLHESLAFTILCQHVHVRVSIKLTSLWPCIHVGSAEPVSIGVKSDTFVPGLKEKVASAYSEQRCVWEVVSLM